MAGAELLRGEAARAQPCVSCLFLKPATERSASSLRHQLKSILLSREPLPLPSTWVRGCRAALKRRSRLGPRTLKVRSSTQSESEGLSPASASSPSPSTQLVKKKTASSFRKQNARGLAFHSPSAPLCPLKPKHQLIKSSLGARGSKGPERQRCPGKAHGPGEAGALCQAASAKLQTGAE